MKKVLFVLIFVVAALAGNAQSSDTKSKTQTQQKTTTTTSKKSTKEDIKVADLQKPISDNIAADYPGYVVKKATKVTLNGVETYEVVVNKGATTQTLVYDKDGKFVKKLSAKGNKPTGKKKK